MNFATYYSEIFCFYGLAGIVILSCFYLLLKKILPSLMFALLIVFVGSEFWEIPIFVSAYLGIPITGYSSAHNELFLSFLNHIVVAFMAIMLIAYSRFSLDRINSAVLILNIAINALVLLLIPEFLLIRISTDFWMHSLLLRVLTLSCLTYIFARAIQKTIRCEDING